MRRKDRALCKGEAYKIIDDCEYCSPLTNFVKLFTNIFDYHIDKVKSDNLSGSLKIIHPCHHPHNAQNQQCHCLSGRACVFGDF